MSAKKRGESDGPGPSRHSNKPKTSSRGGGARGGGARSGDIGRALRSAYDDTVREPIPADFLNLIGKLN